MSRNSFNLTTWIVALATGLLTSQASAGEPTTILKTQQEKDSYAIGADLARNLKRRGVPLEAEAVVKGMGDVLSGGKLLMSDEDLRETLRTLQAAERQKAILARRGTSIVADQAREKGAAFLAQNRTNQDVVCLPDGIQYKILKSATGRKPASADTVECRFRGTLIDGQEFAGSNPDGAPAAFKVGDMVPGLQEALQLMPVGSKWQIFIPPHLAYGDQGVGRVRLGPKIGPSETLIYELELLAIK